MNVKMSKVKKWPGHSTIKKIVATAFLITAVLACGCSDTSFFGGTEENKTEYKISDRIFLPMEKVRTLNPAISKDEDTYFISKLVYNGLFEFDEHLIPQKKLVDSYSYDNDTLTLSLSLKRGVKWHDGKEFTSADVKSSIDAYVSLSYSNETVYSSYVSNIKSVSTDKNDLYKVTVSFKNPGNVAVENLTFPIMPAHQFKKMSDIKISPDRFIPIGTGAYRVEGYNNLSQLVLSANDNYFDKVPQNNLEFVIFPQKKEALNLVNVSNITILYDKDLDRDTLINNMNVKSVDFISNEAEMIGFNFRNPMTQNKKLRQAIACAINLQEILDGAYLKSGVFSDTIYYPNYYGVAGNGDEYDYNLEQALLLLEESGFADIDDDGYIDDQDGKPYSFKILVNSEDQFRVAAAQIIKNGLDKLPLDTYIKYCDWNQYMSDIASGNYDLYIGGYTFNERYDLRNALHSAYNNPLGYSNADLDQLLDEMQSGVSVKRKTELFEQIRAILADEIPYYCILYKTYGAIASDTLEGEVKPLFNNLFNGCEKWMCKYEIPAAVAE